jgi:hypothetical protein
VDLLQNPFNSGMQSDHDSAIVATAFCVSAAEVGVPFTLKNLLGLDLRFAAGADGSPLPILLSGAPNPAIFNFFREAMKAAASMVPAATLTSALV